MINLSWIRTPVSRGFRSALAADGFWGVTEGTRDGPAHADAPRREIARRKWLKRRIRYPRVAHFLRISRILRVNQSGWAASGAAGAAVTGVTSPGARSAPRPAALRGMLRR